ncbi:enamine deaminase RidA (YjgF/YER057c/UK114 family) [Humitalea rosea]|uniref:Enamine deaminase RidA (YjgF/YER057c/UK114 family) n=1 Tax=Humitalea rosea TaxID=990373 RepID=A0A2W7HXK9_9PROT|nr:RidA family protein [Humitalea rosea]PZW38659.1 enamine deaminase RidA (YjgF/YER057c/UK114 family) [Humitalea rosea]
MTGKIEARLAELGLTLPEAGTPIANYIPFTITGTTVYVSGQVPRRDGAIWPTGKLGAGVAVATGQEGARACFLAMLGHLKVAAGGDLDRVKRVLRITGYVSSTPDFTDQPLVVNGASDAAVAIFGEAGRHARTAIGVSVLPGDASVEVEGIFELS